MPARPVYVSILNASRDKNDKTIGMAVRGVPRVFVIGGESGRVCRPSHF